MADLRVETDPLPVEIARQQLEDRLAQRLDIVRGDLALNLERIDRAQHEAQPPDSEPKVVSAEKCDCGGAGPFAKAARDHVRSAPADFVPQRLPERLVPGAAQLGILPGGERGNLFDDMRKFRMAISGVGVACIARRALLRLVPPALQSGGGRTVEEECPAEHRFDRGLHIGPQGIDDPLHPPDPRGAPLDRLKTVADRLFARDIGHGAENCREEARQLGIALSCQPDRAHAGLGIDIDEATIHLAP